MIALAWSVLAFCNGIVLSCEAPSHFSLESSSFVRDFTFLLKLSSRAGILTFCLKVELSHGASSHF